MLAQVLEKIFSRKDLQRRMISPPTQAGRLEVRIGDLMSLPRKCKDSEIKNEERERNDKNEFQQSIRSSHPTLPTSQVEESLETRRYRQ